MTDPLLERVARAIWFAKYGDSGRTWESVINKEHWFHLARAAIEASGLQQLRDRVAELEGLLSALTDRLDGLKISGRRITDMDNRLGQLMGHARALSPVIPDCGGDDD